MRDLQHVLKSMEPLCPLHCLRWGKVHGSWTRWLWPWWPGNPEVEVQWCFGCGEVGRWGWFGQVAAMSSMTSFCWNFGLSSAKSAQASPCAGLFWKYKQPCDPITILGCFGSILDCSHRRPPPLGKTISTKTIEFWKIYVPTFNVVFVGCFDCTSTG